MFLIDGRFNALTVLRVCGETALKGDGVVVLVGLAGEYKILLRGQFAVQTVDAEVDTMHTLFYGGEQKF